MSVVDKTYCEHYRDGLPLCAKCEADRAERNEQMHAQIAELERELAEARAEIERKDKLIEQMKDALQWYKEQVSSCNRNGDAGELARDRLAKDVGKRAEAALSATERGE